MDLTNIKPCVECKWFGRCCKPHKMYRDIAQDRVCRIIVFGRDCFEEVDDG